MQEFANGYETFPPPSVLKVLQTFRVEVHVSELGSGQLAESLDLEDLRERVTQKLTKAGYQVIPDQSVSVNAIVRFYIGLMTVATNGQSPIAVAWALDTDLLTEVYFAGSPILAQVLSRFNYGCGQPQLLCRSVTNLVNGSIDGVVKALNESKSN
ncbi:MAG: hypothetical protein K2Z81_22665 [Cyanobacteria bacterium]|nr:hypothetical protein [Cyanobacteriota bacterium]